MQLYFPNFFSRQGAIGFFDYLMASRDSLDDANVIFDSDLNLEDWVDKIGGNNSIRDEYIKNNDELFSFLGFVVSHMSRDPSNGQLFQDLYVLWKLKNKTHGTFVEIGTAFPNGLNNTWQLEFQFNWNGVLVEPNPFFHKSIQQSRTMPLETRAVYYKSNCNLVLQIPVDFHPGGGLKENYVEKIGSTTSCYNEIDVDTVSLSDCLTKYQISKKFDYLSYDSTGNVADIQTIKDMLEIGYIPKIITYGHNYKNHRQDMHNMLKSYGYSREFDYLSRWDDWYCHNSLKESI
jgi:hypothetical protein